MRAPILDNEVNILYYISEERTMCSTVLVNSTLRKDSVFVNVYVFWCRSIIILDLVIEPHVYILNIRLQIVLYFKL